MVKLTANPDLLRQLPVGHRGAILLAVLGTAAAFFSLGLQDYLSLAFVKEQQGDLIALFDRRPVLVIGSFMAIHVTALALSLPGAVLSMALAGGAIFGPVWGTVIVLSSLTIGDSLGFLIARHLLRDAVQSRFGAHLAVVNAGFERDGPFYLLAMRLMAMMPYFVVNVTVALTPMRLRLFAPVSLIGLLPATALYVNAGTELSLIDEPSDVLSPRLIAAFAALALLPFVTRWWFRARERSQAPKA